MGNLFKEHDLIHNHDTTTGKNIYRYPLIQFKLIDKIPAIIAVTDQAIRIFTEIFMKLNEISIDGIVIPVYEKDLKVEDVEFGYIEDDEGLFLKTIIPSQKATEIYFGEKS